MFTSVTLYMDIYFEVRTKTTNKTMEIISISQNALSTRLMTIDERRIIIEVFHKFRDDRVNFLRMVEAFKEVNDINETKYNDIIRKYRHLSTEQKRDQPSLVFASLNVLTFDKVVATFKQMGCVDMARELIRERFKRLIGWMSRGHIPNVDFVFSFYQKMKSNIDNHIFSSPIGDLNVLISHQTEIMLNKALSTEKRQRAADKVVPLCVLLVQQHWSREDRIRVLEDMKYSVPRDLDTTTVEAVYHSKVAITEAIAGRRSAAIEHAKISEMMCSEIQPCFATILSAHDHQYVYRQCYMRTFQSEDLEEIIRIGDSVMGMVMGDNDEETRNQWKRLVLLFQVLSLLKITSKFDVIDDGDAPSHEHMDIVDVKLREIRWISNRVEVRREMVYSIAMARFKELKSEFGPALTYLSEAVRLANEGGVFFPEEKMNIDRYMARLVGRFKQHRLDNGDRFGDTEPSE